MKNTLSNMGEQPEDENKGDIKRQQLRELEEEFRTEFAKADAAGFESELCKGQLLVEYDIKAATLGGTKGQKRLRDVYEGEFGLSETVAQRLKRVFRFTEEPLVNGLVKIEKLRNIGTSKLDVLNSIRTVRPDAVIFENGTIHLSADVWTGEGMPSTTVLREINSELRTEAMDFPPWPTDDGRDDDGYNGWDMDVDEDEFLFESDDALDVGSDATHETCDGAMVSEGTEPEGDNNDAQGDSASEIMVEREEHDTYPSNARCQDGTLTVSIVGEAFSEASWQYHTWNADLDVTVDRNSTDPRLVLIPIDTNIEAHAFVVSSTTANDETIEEVFLHYNPVTGGYKSIDLTTARSKVLSGGAS